MVRRMDQGAFCKAVHWSLNGSCRIWAAADYGGSGSGGPYTRVCDLRVFPCRGLCAAARAHYPAALPLGLRPGLLQDGAAVSGQALALPVHSTCSCGGAHRERPGWDSSSMWLSSVGACGRPSFHPGSIPPAKASSGGPGLPGLRPENARALEWPGSPRCPGLAHRVTP